jgi:hypothetical protein
VAPPAMPAHRRLAAEEEPMIGFWIELRGPARLWAASIGFAIVGMLIAFVLPRHLPEIAQDAIGSFAIPALGWTFLLLGLLVLLPMLATLYLRVRHPEQEAVWHWWINFIGGLAGALAFAIPAALMFPIFALGYLMRPNVLIPTDAVAANNLGIAALFSVIGVIVLVPVYFLTRLKLREHPKRGV